MPINAKVNLKLLLDGGTNVPINSPGRMTKTAAISSYGKTLQKSTSQEQISRNFGMYYQGLEYVSGFINHDLAISLTYFTASSIWVPCAFEWGKLLKCHGREKVAGNLQMGRIWIILKKKCYPRASSAPALELYTIIFKFVNWYI